jgi:hypothetical protein
LKLKEAEVVQEFVEQIISDAKLSSYNKLKRLAGNRVSENSIYLIVKPTIRLDTRKGDTSHTIFFYI